MTLSIKKELFSIVLQLDLEDYTINDSLRQYYRSLNVTKGEDFKCVVNAL